VTNLVIQGSTQQNKLLALARSTTAKSEEAKEDG